MVGIRSGARPRAQPHTQGGELVEEHELNPESSDDDSEEEIPHTSPPKSKINPGIRSLDHRRTRSQQLDDQLLQIGQFKRRRIEPATNPRNVSSSAVHIARATTSRKESSSSSPEDSYVRTGLVNSLNAVLRREPSGSQHGTSQINGRITAPNNGNGYAKYTHEDDGRQEQQEQQQEHVVADTSRGDESISEHEAAYLPATVLEHDHIVQDGPVEDQVQTDIWDVPVSPEKSRILKQPGPVTSSRRSSRQGGRAKRVVPRRRSEPTRSSQSNGSKAAENPRSSSQGDRVPSLAPIQSEVEVEPQVEIDEDAEGDEDFGHVDRSSQSEENLPDTEPPIEGSFGQDVADFETQYPEGFKGDETYQGPAEDDDIATHIDSYSLKSALQLMRHNAWGGLRTGWHRKSFDINSSETRSVRFLLKLLAKLERLLIAAPKAPQLMEQNKFLNDYSDLVGHYFSEIKSALECIREKYKQGSTNTKLHSDITSCAVPMLFHVLVSAWELGGHDWKRTTFTISTIELLGKTVSWIGLLYRPLLRKLTQQPLDSSRKESKTQQFQREKREELEKYRKDLVRIIGDSIDALEREERRRKREHQILQQNLIRQEELAAQRKQEEEALMMSIRERQRRSLMSIRSTHTPLSESSRPSSRQMSSACEAPSREPARVRPAQVQQSRPHRSGWSLEERTYLFKKIQESYPDLVDLDDIRWDLNRTLEETEVMAEEILGLMLEAVHPEQAKADRDAHIHEVMQAYRRTWGHEK
ncbi:uncharacterized protein F4807DRAFT_419654 [Annulohypoxylon truncatum]|uniref:uncharacterized protein n=1 Tax=Annulohypoxylon truncatum TaxID=327061 RepID=UPI0020081B28|nr:uncharacterized protein F4807DRAFT_419654 [Annulohypoxylon truncatum]KAI1211278.1 hypothetical protein F4807DRAFT_419654 [Annulohypoxylon truncatum]